MNYFILFYFFEVTSSHPSQVRKLLHFFGAKLGRHHIWEVDFLARNLITWSNSCLQVEALIR